MKWHQKIAAEMGSNHSDTMAVIRAGTGKKAKRRTNRRARRQLQEHVRWATWSTQEMYLRPPRR
jgi:hypothetical protein